jgi:hypothetical protein
MISESKAEDLSEEVSQYLAEGWCLYGPPFGHFSQAVIKHDDEPQQEDEHCTLGFHPKENT